MTNQNYTGQMLYHYTRLEGLKGILHNRHIWATEIQDLADETELIYGRDLVAQRFTLEAKRNHDATTSSWLELCAQCTQVLPNISEMIRLCGKEPKINNAKFEWFIACFSEDRDALPLWRGFTDRCRGYALGLRYNPPQDILSSFVHWPPRRIIYSKPKQSSLVREIVAEAAGKMDDPLDSFAWTIPLGHFLTLKAPIFASEREWRVVWSDSDQRRLKRGEYFPQGLSRSVHYVELPLDDWELVEIICGPHAEIIVNSQEIRDGIEAFGCESNNVSVVPSRYRLWR